LPSLAVWTRRALWLHSPGDATREHEGTVKRLMVTILAAALAALYGQRLPAGSAASPSAASVSSTTAHR
jgi:hypothetical protein